MKGMELKVRDTCGEIINGVTITVSGYDTSLPEDEIKSLMNEHFSSCGEIRKVYFVRWVCDKVFVDIDGDDAKEKALQLDGSVVGKRKIVIEAMPDELPDLVIKVTPRNKRLREAPRPAPARYSRNPLCKQIPLRRQMMEASQDSESSDASNLLVRLWVMGYDTTLPEADIKSALIKHFSSFGKVTSILGRPESGLTVAYLHGEAAVVGNMQKLNGGCECVVEGGCKFVVDKVFPLDDSRTCILSDLIRKCSYTRFPDHIQRSQMAKKKAKKKAKKNGEK